jgi:DNA polymerase/3'-5' exonuclease PolX
MSEKKQWPRDTTLQVAQEIVSRLAPSCERIAIAGSIRRRKTICHDVEILFVPRMTTLRDGLFDTKMVSVADEVIEDLLLGGYFAKRPNKNGVFAWGDKNKLAVHTASGIPIDFFSTRLDCWFNYLVCRTGSAESNIRIATAAKAKGWKWAPYGAGFLNRNGDLVKVGSERDVFDFAGLPYLDPEQR